MLLVIVSCESFAFGDPTKPPLSVQLKQQIGDAPVKSKVSTLLLNAIKIQGSHKIATINEQQFEVGDVIGKSRIKSISSNKVVLASGKELSLFDKVQVNVAKKGIN